MDLTKEQKTELVDEVKAVVLGEVKAGVVKEVKADVDKLNKMIVDKFEELKKGSITEAEFKEFTGKVDKRIDELETEVSRPGADKGDKADEKQSAEMKAFENFLRKGVGVLKPEEMKVLKISDATTGSYLAVPEYVNEIIKGVTEFSPIRSIAKVRRTSAYSVQIPKKTSSLGSAQWTSETGERTETTGLAYGMEESTPHEMTALVKITKQDLEDSAFNLQGEITSEIAEQFGVCEGKTCVQGDAVGKPEGFLTNADIEKITSGSSGVIAPDDIFELTYAIKEAYERNAKFVMKRSTVKAIRLLKESTTNAYIWQPGFKEEPQTLAGYPIVQAVDMPAIASNALAVAFGDFQKAYTIVDRIQIEIQRLVEKYAEYGQVGFLARKRVDGQVVLAEALKILKIKA